MGVRVLDPGPEPVVLEAPLGPNTNHRATAFGGSVAALATLAGWAAVQGILRAEGRSAQVVIQRSSIDYLLPVSSAFRASCAGVEPRERSRLKRALERSGRGRAHVDVQVESGGRTVATFSGAYVAIGQTGG